MRPMLLFVTGKYRDGSYHVLDFESKQAKKIDVATIQKLIDSGCVVNAKKWGSKIKGTDSSLSEFVFIDDMTNSDDDVYVVLFKCYNNKELGYMICNQLGAKIQWQSVKAIRHNIDYFCNVSSYWTNRESNQVISQKGFEFSDYDSLYNEMEKKVKKLSNSLSKKRVQKAEEEQRKYAEKIAKEEEDRRTYERLCEEARIKREQEAKAKKNTENVSQTRMFKQEDAMVSDDLRRNQQIEAILMQKKAQKAKELQNQKMYEEQQERIANMSLASFKVDTTVRLKEDKYIPQHMKGVNPDGTDDFGALFSKLSETSDNK